MKSSIRFRIAGLIAASLSLFAQSPGFSAEVGWSSPAATDSPAATLWLNDSTGATTYSQGLLQLNGSRDGLAITGPGGAADAGRFVLSGPTAVIRTGLTAGIQSLNVGTITTSGDWQIDGSGQLVVNAQIIDPLGDVSKITKTGVGALLLNGASTYTGGTTLSQGTLLAGNDRAFGTGALVFNGGAIGSADITPHTFGNAMVVLGDLTVGDSIDALGALTFTSQLDLGDDQRRITTKSNATFTGAISNGGLTKDGLGALILSGTNTYARGTTLTEGSLFAANDAAFGSGVLNFNGGILGSNRGSRTFNNLVSMAAGTIQFGDADHLDALTFTGNTSLAAGRHTFNTVANATFSGVIEGQSASLIKSGMGVLTLSNLNSYDGGTDLQAGTVRLANNDSIGSGAITFSGGTLASASNESRAITNNLVFNGSATIGDGSNTGAFLFLGSRNDLGGLTRTITTNVSTTVSNGLVGTGGLIKTGLESLTLRGASSFTGDTAVQRGRLVLDGTLASRNVTVAGGASFGGTVASKVSFLVPEASIPATAPAFSRSVRLTRDPPATRRSTLSSPRRERRTGATRRRPATTSCGSPTPPARSSPPSAMTTSSISISTPASRPPSRPRPSPRSKAASSPTRVIPTVWPRQSPERTSSTTSRIPVDRSSTTATNISRRWRPVPTDCSPTTARASLSAPPAWHLPISPRPLPPAVS
jgi:autotransporter-associated beta strand protein